MNETEIERLEKAVLSPDARAEGETPETLIDDDFQEFSGNGTEYNKAEVVALLSGLPGGDLSMSGFRIRELSSDHVLVTYTFENSDGRRSYRSSVWRHDGERWKIRFHQGTPISDLNS